MDSEAFKKITQPDERRKLLEDLVARRGEILCKGKGDSIFKLKAYSYGRNKLYCTISNDSVQMNTLPENLIGNFLLGGEKYFFQGIAELLNNEVVLDTNFDLFHLQRRQNYRIKVPSSYRTVVTILEVNGKPATKLIATMHDLSGGGSRISYQPGTVVLKAEDAIKAKIAIGSKEPFEVSAVIRHVATDPIQPKLILLGLEFKALPPALESRIFGITMDLYRELFSKLNYT